MFRLLSLISFLNIFLSVLWKDFCIKCGIGVYQMESDIKWNQRISNGQSYTCAHRRMELKNWERLISHKCLIFYKPRLYLLFSEHPLSISLHPQANYLPVWSLIWFSPLRTSCSWIEIIASLSGQLLCFSIM